MREGELVGCSELVGIRKLREDKVQRRQRERRGIGRYPLIGLLLDTDGMVVGEPVSARNVFRLCGRSSVAHHHVQDRNRPAEGRESPQEDQRQETAPGWAFLIHP